jgi:hypothetical protein
MHGALNVLTGNVLEPLKPTKNSLLKPQKLLNVLTLAYNNSKYVKLITNRRVFNNNVKSNNKAIIEKHKRAHVELRL